MTDIEVPKDSDTLQDADSAASPESSGNKAKLVLSILRQ